MNSQVEFLVKLRDAARGFADTVEEYIQSLASSEIKNEQAPVQEAVFADLKFELQKGAKIGEFEVATKDANFKDKWQQAFDVLRDNSATIKDRFHPEGYLYSYWLYGQDRIYREKLMPK